MSVHTWRVVIFMLIVAIGACSSKNKNEPGQAAVTGDARPAAEQSAAKSIAWQEQWRGTAAGGLDAREIWKRYAESAEAELSRPGADPSDIRARSNALGGEAQEIFEFMRAEVLIEPYAGTLRGARGTLAAGAGNALDRALLAQALLHAAGVESRLVAGKLTDEQATTLLDRFLDAGALTGAMTGLGHAPDATALKSEAVKVAAATGMSEAAINELLAHTQQQTHALWERIETQSKSQLELLSGQLRQGKVKMTVDHAALSGMLKDRLRHHYWLQIRERDGSWSEFDPSFTDARQGVAYGSEPTSLAAVPEEEYHRLQFKLINRTLSSEGRSDEILIDDTFRSADTLFEPIEFRIQPTALPADPDTLAGMDVKQRIAALKGISRFRSVLRVGPRVTASRAFDLAGKTYGADGSLLGTTDGTFFNDAFSGGEEAPPQFIDLRVELILTGPGREPVTQERTLVRASDVTQPGFAPPILNWDILFQPQWVSSELVGLRALEQTMELGNALFSAAASDKPVAAFQPPPAEPVLLLQVALLRQVAAARMLERQASVRAFVDEPLLTIAGHRLNMLDEQKGFINVQRSIDIVANAVRYVAKSENAQTAAYDAALAQAAADSAIEEQALREIFPDAVTYSGAAIFGRARAEGRAVTLAKPQDIDLMRSNGLSEPDIEWIYDHEPAEARLLIATMPSGPNAWWSIRPDGNAILRVSGGEGAGLAEYALNTTKIGLAVVCLVQFGLTEYNSQETGGIWSEEGANETAKCLALTALAGGLFMGGITIHALHWASLALAGYEIVHLAQGAWS